MGMPIYAYFDLALTDVTITFTVQLKIKNSHTCMIALHEVAYFNNKLWSSFQCLKKFNLFFRNFDIKINKNLILFCT
jgi:hypothetical protein